MAHPGGAPARRPRDRHHGGAATRQRRSPEAIGCTQLALIRSNGSGRSGSNPAIRLDWRWKATVTYDWGPTFDETFTLRPVGGTVAGSAGFLGHGRTILDGSLQGSSLRFVTKRVITARSDQREGVNRFAGIIEGDKIDMVVTIEDAASSHEPVSFTLSRVLD